MLAAMSVVIGGTGEFDAEADGAGLARHEENAEGDGRLRVRLRILVIWLSIVCSFAAPLRRRVDVKTLRSNTLVPLFRPDTGSENEKTGKPARERQAGRAMSAFELKTVTKALGEKS